MADARTFRKDEGPGLAGTVGTFTASLQIDGVANFNMDGGGRYQVGGGFGSWYRRVKSNEKHQLELTTFNENKFHWKRIRYSVTDQWLTIHADVEMVQGGRGHRGGLGNWRVTCP